MRKSKGNVLAVLLVIILTLGCVGVFFAFFKDNIADEKVNERIIEVTEDNGKLSSAQIKSLDNGADIQYNGEIYRLSQTGEENVYAHNDEENIFVRKYIAVNTSDGFYRSWNKVNDEYVTKALLNTALSDYATDKDINSALNSALGNYATNADVQSKLNAALTNYMTSADAQKLLTATLASYVKSSDGKDIITYHILAPGKELIFEAHSMYVVQCYDTTNTLADFTILGGGKNGTKGRFAMAFIGVKNNNTSLQYNSMYVYDLFKYLRLYEQFPQMEYLMKMGLHRYVMSKTILRNCKDKAFCKWLYRNKNNLSNERYYDVSVVIKAYKTGKPLKDLQKEAEIIKTYSHDERLKSIRKYFKGELPRLAEYIVSQNTDTSSYRDYYIACEQLNLDMNLKKNRYPKEFKHWHDIRIDEYNTAKLKADEERRKEFYCKFLDVTNKYLSLQKEGKNYCVIIAKSPAELVKEGDYLHHCVGRMNYDQKFTREESLIFFIRLSSTPNVPLATVEYSLKSHKVLQCYGDHDSKPDNGLLNYVKKVWLPYANKQIQSLAA